MKKSLLIVLSFTQLCLVFGQWEVSEIQTESGLNSTFFTDLNTGYVVGGGSESLTPDTTDAVIYKTVDGGESWDLVYSKDSLVFRNVFVIDGVVYIYGKSSATISVLTKSFDEGVTWEEPIILDDNILTMELVGSTLYYSYAGNTGSGLNRVENDSVMSIADDISIFGVYENEVVYVNQGCNAIFKSTDKGDTWNQLTNYPLIFGGNQTTNATIRSFGEEIRIHSTYSAYNIYSHDNGNTWDYVLDDPAMSKTLILNDSIVYGIDNSYNKICVTNTYPNINVQMDNSPRNLRRIYFYNNDFGVITGNKGLLYIINNATEHLNLPFNSTASFKIYPNPIIDKANISLSEFSEVETIGVYDIHGRNLGSDFLQKETNNRYTFLRKALTSGIYFIAFRAKDRVGTVKVIVK